MGGARSEGQGGPQARARKRALSLTVVSTTARSNRSKRRSWHLTGNTVSTATQRFMARFAETCQGVVAIDGKVLRRSFDQASGKSALHMVSAWGCEQRLVLGQVATGACPCEGRGQVE